MTSFVVLVAVLCVTVNMTRRVAATTPANTDEDYNADYEDDDASQEDHHQNLTHFLRHQNHSSFVTPTPEETDTDYPDFVANFGLGNPDLVVGLPEGRLHNSSGVFSQFSTHETLFQTLTSTMNWVGSLDTSQVAEPLEEISSVAFSEKSEIEDVQESSTFFRFSSQLVSSTPGSVISVFLSSGFATPETVISENITSNAAVIVASTGARNLASTPTRTVASTPLGSVASTPAETISSTDVETVVATPAGTVTSTPFETLASTRVGTVASTSVGNIASTRSRNLATTPVETVASTPSGNVDYSRAGIVASAPTGIIASTPVRTIASTPVRTVASTPAGIVGSTPAGIVASTPVETTASTPIGIVASTPAGTVASTPAGIVASTSARIVSSTAVGTAASTPVGTVASTPVENVASTLAGTVGSSRAGIVASTPVGLAASTHVETVASTPVGTVASTPAGIVTVTPPGIVSPTPVGIAASTPAADEPTSSLTLYNSFPSSMHEANIHSSMSQEADQAITSEHVELTAMEYAESTAAEHAESTAAIHAESVTSIHEESTAAIHAESTAAIHAESTAAIHAESTAVIHAESTAVRHAESTAARHPESTTADHAESTAARHPESTAAIHAESTAAEHAESTAAIYAESTAIRHAESTAARHPESTAADHAESTAARHPESTAAIHAESTAAIHAESTAAIRVESTVTMQVESTFLKHRESTIAQAESVSTLIEIWNVSTRTSLQDSPHAAYETSIDFHAGMSSYVALISADIRSNLISAAQETSRFVILSSTYSVTLLYSDSSQAGETAQRDAFMAISSYECCISSSFGSSLQDTVSATVYTPESSTFPGDLNIQTSTSDMPAASFYHTYSQPDAKLSSVVLSALHTPLFLDGSVQPTSTMFSQSSLTQSLSSSRDIHISPKEHTAAATSLHEASEDSIGFSHSFQDTLHSHITSSFDSSLHLTQATVLFSDTVLLTEHLRSSSRYDTPSVSDAFLSSVQDAPSRTETVDSPVYRTLDVSDFATSFGYDRIHTPGIIDTTIHDSRHPLEENNTSRYHVLHTINDTVASTYEGWLTASSNVFSSHLLMHDSTTQGGYLDTRVESELQTSYFQPSSILASSTARKTTLLFATSLSTPHHFAPETISVFSQWESGRRSVDVATLSSTFTSTITTEGASTIGQGSPVTSSATTYRQTSWILTETSFGIPTSIQQIPTSIHRDISTLTTSLSTTITTQTTTVENTTTPATTKHTTQHIETSTDLVPKATSNFTIAIYFYGDCEKASEKKYTGILNAKMLQFIRNISQIDDKSSILIGHIKCKPNHIPVSFFQADRTLVFLYLNDTFSTSPRYLRIHSLILNLTGYSEGFDASKRKGESEITTSDITIFATASCICLVLIIAGLAIFTKEIYHKKFSSRFSCPGSLGIHLKSETVALRSFPANKTDYKHSEMNEAAFVNEAYSSRCEDEQSSGVSEMKTAFPSSECSSPEETRDATRSKAPPEKNAGNATKSTVATPVSLSNGTSRHEPPGYGLIIGLMGYTKRLERQQQRNEHQQQQQKLHFEESSYYAVPQKRSKPARNQDNTKTNVSPTPASYSPASRPVTIEDSPVPPPRHLRTLHEVNELYESNEELVPCAGTTGADKPTNAISQTDTGLDNPSFLHERGRADVDSTDVFHF